MPNLSIKDVPEHWAEALRRRAALNHRSLQGELMSIIEAAATGMPAGVGFGAAQSNDPGRPRIVGYDKRGYPIIRQGWKTPEQLAAESKAKYPHPILGQPLAVDIIREARDSR